jgi:hypothetical protein
MSAPQRFVPDPRVEAAIEFAIGLGIDAPWETNGQGQVILNPPRGLAHAKRADRISVAIRSLLPDWRVWPGVGIHTADGVKAPDLAVAAPDFAEATDSRGFLVRAPRSAWRSCRPRIPGKRCATRPCSTGPRERGRCGCAMRAAALRRRGRARVAVQPIAADEAQESARKAAPASS